MLKVSTPPYITMLIAVNIMNIFFSTYFITLLFIGVTFKILTVSIKEERNLIIFLSILTFLVIENSQGLKIFSLTLSSMVIYLFVVPRLKNLFSSTVILDFIYIFILYIIFYILTQSYLSFDLSLISILVVNFLIDIIIVGLIL